MYKYNEQENYNYELYNVQKHITTLLASCSVNNGVISNFQPKQPFRAVDWNEIQSLIDKGIGKPQITLDSNLPSNCIWLEGATVSRTTYASLFAIYGTTYGAGDGSTTFVLPDFRNRAIWGANGFGYLSAGLPNITGSAGQLMPMDYTYSTSGGAIYTTESENLYGSLASGSKHRWQYLNFSASLSNSIYGNSSTVQPPAIKVRVYTKYQ
jgi:microcystin-dependent protein